MVELATVKISAFYLDRNLPYGPGKGSEKFKTIENFRKYNFF
jgi:hypothetical protein